MITILCSGSRGDYQPYIALAQALQRRGKEVRITGGGSSEAHIRSYGIGFYPLSADYLTAEIDPKMLEAAQSSDNPLKMLLTFHKMKDYAVGLAHEMFCACKDSELILYHPGCAIGYFAGERLGIPSILAAPFPMHKSREVASLISYGKTKMPIALSHSLLQGMLWMAAKPGIQSYFKKEHGRVPARLSCPFEKVDKRHPAVISCSNHVFPRPSDWNENIHQAGYWFVEEPSGYTPPHDLAGFLASGEKPLYFGFGSVFDSRHREETVAAIAGALRQTGKRGILSGMGEIRGLPDNMLAIGSIPHGWLFERVAMVCHHGGAGTTAAGFRAGVPSLIVPFSNDQFAWAHRAFHLGVGAPPIYRKSLNGEKLTEGIRAALKEDTIEKAAALGRRIALENGAAECADIVLKRLLEA